MNDFAFGKPAWRRAPNATTNSMACQKETDAAFPRLSTTRDRMNHYLRFGACTGDDLKDVYAQFGLTFSHGCNVEAILANVILASDFVKNVVTESRNAGKPIYTKDECGRRFDDFLIKQHKQTMGKLVGGIEGLIELDEALEERVEDALRRRNYLAHDFWRERGGEAISRQRRDAVLKDLVADQEFFEQLAKDLENVANSELTKLGLDGEGLRTRVDESVQKLAQELAK